MKYLLTGLLFFFLTPGYAGPEAQKKGVKKSIQKKSRQAQAPSITSSLQAVIRTYAPTLGKLGSNETGEQVRGLKKSLAYHLGANAETLKLLVNPTTGAAWFANLIIAVEPEGKAYFIDKAGKQFSAHLKDRVFGGTFTDDKGRLHFISAFFASMNPGDFYHVYVGTEKAKVVSFNLDREREGSISAAAQTKDGQSWSITRRGRDNKTVLINAKPLTPLFQ
jgi:hypothetical protein